MAESLAFLLLKVFTYYLDYNSSNLAFLICVDVNLATFLAQVPWFQVNSCTIRFFTRLVCIDLLFVLMVEIYFRSSRRSARSLLNLTIVDPDSD